MPIDLSCDQIIYDPAQDEWRMESRDSGIADSVLGAQNMARLTVLGFNYADSAALDRTLYVALSDSAHDVRLGGSSDSSRVELRMLLGEYALRVTCMGCSRADSAIHATAGTVATVAAYLTRFPDNCEADSIRAERARTDSGVSRSDP